MDISVFDNSYDDAIANLESVMSSTISWHIDKQSGIELSEQINDISDNELENVAHALATQLIATSTEQQWHIASAESLTGGLLADAFISVAGASAVFLGSAVTYDIRAKAQVLGVEKSLLKQAGAVNAPVACQMAQCTARLYGQSCVEDADFSWERLIGLSTTGVAGPGPDGILPAGLVYIGVNIPVALLGDTNMRRFNTMGVNVSASNELNIACQLRLDGNRERIRKASAAAILQYVTQLTMR